MINTLFFLYGAVRAAETGVLRTKSVQRYGFYFIYASGDVYFLLLSGKTYFLYYPITTAIFANFAGKLHLLLDSTGLFR